MATQGSTELALSAETDFPTIIADTITKATRCNLRHAQCKLLPDKTDIEGGQASVQGDRAGVNAHQGHPPRVSNHIKRQDGQIIVCARVHHTMDYLYGTERMFIAMQ